jgi:hypothetical protein
MAKVYTGQRVPVPLCSALACSLTPAKLNAMLPSGNKTSLAHGFATARGFSPDPRRLSKMIWLAESLKPDSQSRMNRRDDAR